MPPKKNPHFGGFGGDLRAVLVGLGVEPAQRVQFLEGRVGALFGGVQFGAQADLAGDQLLREQASPETTKKKQQRRQPRSLRQGLIDGNKNNRMKKGNFKELEINWSKINSQSQYLKKKTK